MPPQSSTQKADRHTADSEFVIRDGRIGRYGYVFLDDLDSDEFRSLKGAAVRVYLTLLPYAAKGSGEAYPRQGTIARINGIRRETVNRAMRELERAGLLERTGTWKGSDGQIAVVYTLMRPPSRRPPGAP